jgi:hypothetical protein
MLFDSARNRGGTEFIYTLLRVEGMSYGIPDPLIAIRAAILAGTDLPQDADHEPLRLLENLLRCAAGEPYRGLARDDGGAYRQTVAAKARSGGYVAIADAIDGEAGERDQLARQILDSYDRERRRFLTARRIHKLPDFAVLEILVDDEVGLGGFRVHFSNGSFSEFRRTDVTTEPMNITFDPGGGVVFFVGDTSGLVSEWRIDGRPLYEVGLEGRYNPVGEWRPLVYPAKWDEYAERARTASDRPEVQGALLYVFLTGHHAVEFAARTSVELPHELVSFGGGRLELHKVPAEIGAELIYDGTVYLEVPDAEHVEAALRDVQALVNRIAFTFDASVAWVPKYTTVFAGGGHATPSDDDMYMLDRLLGAGGDPGRTLIDEAIDWYNRGRSATNEFVAFLCSYISFESSALALWRGDFEGAVFLDRPSRAERRKETARCIRDLHKLEYEEDPVAFVKHAYFECVESLKRRVARVAESVFGSDAPAVRLLFENREGYSLADVRSALAHGRLSLADPAARELVGARLAEIQDVAREFLLRIALNVGPTEQVPEWSRLHQLGVEMTDPRATMCTTSLDHLPQTGWRIQAGWID